MNIIYANHELKEYASMRHCEVCRGRQAEAIQNNTYHFP